ncbi:hypothetical protein Leryth_023756 [Lithospermum erythrorhizon]|nr:hypothetical protein Leryth_023756 [Lithospermum erythrorhizon]
MEFSVSGNSLKTLGRSVTCLARIGNDLTIQASPSQLEFHSLNTSRSAFQSITMKPDFFDIYTIIGNGQIRCSVLLKAICAVLRTPLASIDRLSIHLPDPDAPKVQWTLECFNGVKKSYWIACNIEPDIQQLSLDRRRLPSNFVVRPRDLNRLLANFQSNLEEITVISTERSFLPPDAANEIGGKVVELRSYVDPTKDNDSSLYTQLWIDPAVEFVQYNHTGDPVDVTFGAKELKAFLSFCEGCEVDIHFYFDKSGEPILMVPEFGLDDGSSSNFDATLVLATMLTSQLNDTSASEAGAAAADSRRRGYAQEASEAKASVLPATHTRIWSELSGSAARSGNGTEDRQGLGRRTENSNEQREIDRIGAIYISKGATGSVFDPDIPINGLNKARGHMDEPKDTEDNRLSQHHPCNWLDAEDEDDDGEEPELCVQPTPPYCEEK